jgi:hypothetical protein
MTIRPHLAIFLFTCFFTKISFASDHLPRVKMMMTLINQSQHTLIYSGVTDANPEDIFLVSPKIILPGSSVTITSVSNDYNVPDLSGNLHFDDTQGKSYAFRVSDAKQMHYNTEAHFVLKDGKSISKLIARSETPLMMTYSSELA